MQKTAAVLAATVVATLGGIAVAPQAQAATTLQARVFAIAKAQEGKPYRYGATGPGSYDCSGLTQYAYKHAGKSIRRTAQEQFNHVSRHLWPSQLKAGDLVFFGTVHNIFHVGVYAGGGKIINAPHTGTVVKLAPISQYGSVHIRHYGRV